MSFEEILVGHLHDNASLTGLVGTRLFPSFAPDSVTKPYVTYLVAAVGSEYTHDGPANTTWTVQFSIFAERYQQATAIRDVLMSALSGYKGLVASGSDSLDVVSLHSSTRHFYEADTRLHHVAIDFEMTV